MTLSYTVMGRTKTSRPSPPRPPSPRSNMVEFGRYIGTTGGRIGTPNIVVCRVILKTPDTVEKQLGEFTFLPVKVPKTGRIIIPPLSHWQWFGDSNLD